LDIETVGFDYTPGVPYPTRRVFLTASSRTALGLSLCPFGACSRQPESARPVEGSLTTTIEAMEARVPALLQSTRTPGLSVALIADARVAWTRGFGVSSASSRAPVTPATVFDAASISKTVFAYAVMKLHERGVLDIDTPLTKYTEERWVHDPRFDLITARQVLSHTGGLQNWRTSDDSLRIHFTPGAQWMYSGEGYSYLQSVVARLTGRDIDGYLRAQVFEPFGMSSTGFLWREALAAHYAAPHDGMGAVVATPRPTATTVARYGSAGGMWTTAAEYARFLVEVIDPKPQDAFRLSRTTRDEMIRPQVKVDETSSWALGWRILHGNTGDLIAHGGENVGFQNFVAASVVRKAGYVIMTNGDNGIKIIAELTNGATPLNALVSG
jgi:CubicO group peptidase (beta-lactamase class C family)